jgi:hypothetical protein
MKEGAAMKRGTSLAAAALTAAVAAALHPAPALAQGVVTRSGSTWTGRVNSTTVYTGSRMFDCVNAVINAMSSGTITIRNSGDSGPGIGNVYAIRPKSNMTLDFGGVTVNGNGDEFVVGIYADRKSNITIRNVRLAGRMRYATWFRGCSNVRLENTTIALNNNGLGHRYDHSTAASSGLTVSGTTTISGTNHGIETYGTNGGSIGNVTVSNTNGAGVLLNQSVNFTVGTVTGNGNNWGGGYATYRVANNNRANTCARVHSRHSGRGFFSVSGSSDATVTSVDISDTWSHGIFLENASNTRVNGGTVGSTGAENVRHVNCNNCRTAVNGQVYTAANGGWE